MCFTKSLPSYGHLPWFHYSSFWASCHSAIGLTEKVLLILALKNISNSRLGLEESFLRLPSYEIGFKGFTAQTMRSAVFQDM
jgi:hypothetical protein